MGFRELDWVGELNSGQPSARQSNLLTVLSPILILITINESNYESKIVSFAFIINVIVHFFPFKNLIYVRLER